ncbi:hypothetical protein D3H35_14340 [Cohnella faecalis]|uniref:Uncharacterized protein n=1 Tax=Cohnella faecalis TaxID=2315694 RepID=A0A398CMB4_9BACL|nr:hypothetical protein D3H35_14340 [Cohnella faecalis]
MEIGWKTNNGLAKPSVMSTSKICSVPYRHESDRTRGRQRLKLESFSSSRWGRFIGFADQKRLSLLTMSLFLSPFLRIV